MASWKAGAVFPAKYDSAKPCMNCGQTIKVGQSMQLTGQWGKYMHAGTCPKHAAHDAAMTAAVPIINAIGEPTATLTPVQPTHSEVGPQVKPSLATPYDGSLQLAYLKAHLATVEATIYALSTQLTKLHDERQALNQLLGGK